MSPAQSCGRTAEGDSAQRRGQARPFPGHPGPEQHREQPHGRNNRCISWLCCPAGAARCHRSLPCPIPLSWPGASGLLVHSWQALPLLGHSSTMHPLYPGVPFSEGVFGACVGSVIKMLKCGSGRKFNRLLSLLRRRKRVLGHICLKWLCK